MKTLLKKLCVQLFGYFIWSRGNRGHCYTFDELRLGRLSFSQFGEDLVIEHLLQGVDVKDSYYCDVGAHHPIYCSNTLVLYRKGYRGINIDADDSKIAAFQRHRPEDENLAAPVAGTAKECMFVVYRESITNRLVDLKTPDTASLSGQPALEAKLVTTRTLDSILEHSRFRDRQLALLSVDCEGEDFAILSSFDFDRYSPTVVCVESFSKLAECPIHQLLLRQSYDLCAQTGFSRIYRESPAELS